MALSHSPSIITNGLVYYHDMGNTLKSWKGAPAVNLFGTNLSATNFQKTLSGITYNGYRAVGIANDNPRTYLYIGSLTVAASTFYTLSCVYWSSNNIVDDVYLYFPETGWPEGSNYIQPFSTQSVTRNGSFSITDLGGGWKYCVGTFQTLATTTTLGQLFFDVDVAGVEVFIANIQLEQNTFATPYVAGTRSNTQAILDLTGKRTVTATSLIYASDNTFSFNGSTTYITAPNTELFHGTNGFSYSIWANWASLPSLGTIFENGLYTAGILIRFQSNAIAVYAEYSATTYQSTMAFTPTIGLWSNLVLTREGNVLYLYANGIQIGTAAFGASINIQPSTNLLYIGMSQHSAGQCFNGKIAIASIYNRALSAAEVAQNFNALKGRYGL